MAEVPPFLWADSGTFTSPHTYEVPGSGEVQPYTATATYVNASGQAILPALRIKSDSGNLLTLTFPVGQTIADGASSEVTFVPPFGSAQGSGGSVNPIVANQLDYVEITSAVTVLPANTFSNQKTIIASNSLNFDGATRVRIEVFTPTFDVDTSNNFILELWDNSTDLGRLGQLNVSPSPNDFGSPLYLATYYTPSVGAHTFTIKGWTATAVGFETFTAGPGGLGGGGNPNYLPGWLRISV